MVVDRVFFILPSPHRSYTASWQHRSTGITGKQRRVLSLELLSIGTGGLLYLRSFFRFLDGAPDRARLRAVCLIDGGGQNLIAGAVARCDDYARSYALVSMPCAQERGINPLTTDEHKLMITG